MGAGTVGEDAVHRVGPRGDSNAVHRDGVVERMGRERAQGHAMHQIPNRHVIQEDRRRKRWAERVCDRGHEVCEPGVGRVRVRISVSVRVGVGLRVSFASLASEDGIRSTARVMALVVIPSCAVTTTTMLVQPPSFKL